MTAAESAALAPWAIAVLALMYAYLLWPACRIWTACRKRNEAEEKAIEWARRMR